MLVQFIQFPLLVPQIFLKQLWKLPSKLSLIRNKIFDLAKLKNNLEGFSIERVR